MPDNVLIIEPGRADSNYWRDVWRYRELLHVLAWRDLSVRYKQTTVGIAWAVIRPFLTMLILTVVFGRLANLPTEGTAPYSLMVLAGVLPWTLFTSLLTETSNSIVLNANLIGKVFFPRLIVPVSTVVVALADFFVSFLMLLLLMIWFGYLPNWKIGFLPFFIVMALLASLGPSLWIAALNVKYRDFRYVVPFVVQFGLYASPVGFTSNVIPEKWRLLYSLNPAVGVIDGFRWSVLGQSSEFHIPGLLASICITLLFLWFGLRQFRRTEKRFADLL